MTIALSELSQKVAQFVKERDWDQYHSPKNLAMALSVEVAELVEIFQWLTPEQSQSLGTQKLVAIQDELGDVLIYLIRLADKLEIDLIGAAERKLAKNEEKYPIALVKGKAHKYTEYGND